MEHLSEMNSGIWSEEAEAPFTSEEPDAAESGDTSISADNENGGEVSDTLPVSDKEDDCETDSESRQEDGKSAEEAIKRAEHEAAETKRKAEWEAAQQAKKVKIQEQLERIKAMADEDVMMESMKRVSADTEKLTRRNMKECVSEYIQTMCLEDPVFARLVMQPKKNMVHCFWYINRKAREFIKQEMKNNDISLHSVYGVYCSDVPDDLCYQWAVEYFHDAEAEEDNEKDEEFVPKPYTRKTSSKGKTKKKTESKPTEKKQSNGMDSNQNHSAAPTQISLFDFTSEGNKG